VRPTPTPPPAVILRSLRRELLLVLLALVAASLLPAQAPIGPTPAAAAKKAKKKKKAKHVACKTSRRGKAARKGTRRCSKAKRPKRTHAQRAPVRRPAAIPPITTPKLPLPKPPVKPPVAPSPPASARPFAPTSFWNTPLASNAALDAKSSTYTGQIQQQLTKWLPWINTTKYSSPVYTVGASQPTVRVKLDYPYAPDLQAAWDQVPIPAGAKPADGTDKTMIVWQPSTDTMWEFWVTEKRADGWHARWGGRMRNVSASPGYYENPSNWGATATSLPMLGGLIRLDELKAGRIDHALALCLPETRSGWHSWPAQRSDGTVDSEDAVPEGTRFRLDPKLNVAALGLPRTSRIIAEAAQKYGVVVRDRGGAVSFYAEDPTPTGFNPFTGLNGFFDGRYPSQLLERFPWSRLQALRGQLSRG
jgi:hypothetical protein